MWNPGEAPQNLGPHLVPKMFGTGITCMHEHVAALFGMETMKCSKFERKKKVRRNKISIYNTLKPKSLTMNIHINNSIAFLTVVLMQHNDIAKSFYMNCLLYCCIALSSLPVLVYIYN